MMSNAISAHKDSLKRIAGVQWTTRARDRHVERPRKSLKVLGD
jgi:hypothetical protein